MPIGISSLRFPAAGTYPRPVSMVSSMLNFASAPNVQITKSGFKISMSEPASIIDAFTTQGPTALIVARRG